MENRISGKTSVCGVIGDPIEHTMSPAMHNAAFEELGLDFIYTAFRVNKDELSKSIDGMRALNIKGLNVTIPHKVAVIPLLDNLDPMAEKIGAVNTIVNDEGILTGYNTDASGFLQALLGKGIESTGKHVVIMGAGGASKAISFALAETGSHLVILNRREEFDWAVELALHVSRVFGIDIPALELSENNLSKVMKSADILINATSVGMSPNANESPMPAGLLKPNLTVFDIVYNPIETKLLEEAKAAGAQTIGGIDMLSWQGALAFKKWTSREAPLDLMRKEAIKALGNEN